MEAPWILGFQSLGDHGISSVGISITIDVEG